MLTLIISVLIGILQNAFAAPYLDTTPMTINSVTGEQVILPCNVKNLGLSSIIWFSPSGAPIATDTTMYSQDSRFKIRQPDISDFNLVLDNVKESDEGVYICMVMGGQDEKRVSLKILAPPRIDNERSTPNIKVIKEGETLMLQCIASGKPDPVIKWYRTVETDLSKMTKEDLRITGSELTVKNIAREEAGSYHCEVSNGLPPDVSREIIVTIHFQPQIYPQNDKLSKKPGKNVIFECVAEGYPLPQVVWEKNGELLPKNTTKYRQEVYEDKDTLILSLRINNLEDNDFGTYICDAKNIYGRVSHEYILEKTGAPKIQVASTLVRKMKSENAELECRVRGFPRSVDWFKNREKLSTTRRYALETYKEDDITVSSLTIVTLETSDFAVYICLAENEYGSDEMTIRLEQSTIDIGGPSEAKVGKEISIVCNATTDSIGNDSISWLKNGRPLTTSSRITTSRDINADEQRIYSKLYIRDMKIGDKGTYTCRTKRFLFASHSLSIIEVPDEFVNIDRTASSPTLITVIENSGQIQLVCKVEAYPRIMIFWYKYKGANNGLKEYKELSSGDEVLLLDSTRSMAGDYQCRASNGRQAEETLDITVDIQYPVKVSVFSNNIRKEIGQPLILECNITGNPISRKFWLSPKGPNATFDHTLEIVNHETYITAAMKIMNVKLEDLGTYTCVGGNNLGNDTATVTVLPIFTTTTTSTTTTTTPTPPTSTSTKATTLKVSTVPEPEPTNIPKETGKEHVKQDNDKGNNSSCSQLSYLLLILTVVITFRCFYGS